MTETGVIELEAMEDELEGVAMCSLEFSIVSLKLTTTRRQTTP